MYVCIYKDKIFDFKIDVIFGFCILNIFCKYVCICNNNINKKIVLNE